MTITSRFESLCPVCQQSITVGTKVEWSRGSRARHINCQPVARPQLSEEDPEFGREDDRSPHKCPARGMQMAQHGGPCRRPAARPSISEARADFDAHAARTSNGGPIDFMTSGRDPLSALKGSN